MSFRNTSQSLGGLFTGLVVLFSLVLPAAAATSPPPKSSGNGMRVSPVVTNLTINPGEAQTVSITIQNLTNGAVSLQALVNDFTSTNETGSPALLLNNSYAPTHSLKRYVEPIGNVTLAPNEQKTITVNIALPKNLPGGGYYGAIRFTPASANNNGNVSLSASVGSLILVRVPGDFKEQLQLTSFDVRTNENSSPQVIFTTSKNLVAVARFQNQGDVQEQPFGKIALKQGSTELAVYELNDVTPRGNVLPASIRKFIVPLDKVGAFGQYTVTGNFGFGTNGQLLSGSTTFYVIPLTMILVILGLIALILFAIFGLPRLIRSYNQRVVARAKQSR